MDEQIQDAADSDAAKKTPPAGGGAPPANDAERIKALEKENQQLKQQVIEFQKQVDELLAAQKAAANRAKSQALVRKLERQGLKFGSDEEKDAEINRLAGLSDDGFAASEAAYSRMTQAMGGKSDTPDKPDKAAEQTTQALRTDAGVRPFTVDDKNDSLEEQLKQGFQQAYDDRLSRVQA